MDLCSVDVLWYNGQASESGVGDVKARRARPELRRQGTVGMSSYGCNWQSVGAHGSLALRGGHVGFDSRPPSPIKMKMNKKRDRRGYLQDYYQRNKLHKNANASWRAQLMTAALRWYKSAHPCMDCGEGDPVVLEFDHVRGTKEFTIGHQGPRIKSLKRVWEEVQKCEVVCGNCHARRTIRGRVERGWVPA